MKGMVFTEFIEFVEDNFGFEITQKMIDNSKSKGIYTGVGSYPSSELVSMVLQLSDLTKTDVPVLLVAYGKHLFHRFSLLYPHFFHQGVGFFDFISKIDDYIHVEVQKLYPDAELPSIEIIEKGEDFIEFVYTSKRRLGDFAHGLLLGAADYFESDVDIEKELLIEDGSKVKFILKLKK